nr:hypothetical protein [Tanacetum cinerariifolium]
MLFPGILFSETSHQPWHNAISSATVYSFGASLPSVGSSFLVFAARFEGFLGDQKRMGGEKPAFTISTLERVTIGCCEVGGGGGGGGGGVWVVSMLFVVMVLIEELEVLIVELFVDLFVGLFVVVFVEEMKVKAPISVMIVRVPEKDRWCGTRDKIVRWKGVRVTKASKHA